MTESPTEPKLAPHLRDLPRDRRRFLVPAEAPWDENGPALSQVDPVLRLILAGFRACPVCGFALRTDEPVWRIYDERTRLDLHKQLRLGGATEHDTPGHLICMLYSALVCPYWRLPGSRLSRANTYVPGGRRGEAPAIPAFETYGVLMDTSQPLGAPGGDVIALERLVDELPFTDPWLELAERYDTERKRVGGRYVGRRRRHYAPQFGGRERLRKDGAALSAALTKHGPDQWTTMAGQRRALVWAGWAS